MTEHKKFADEFEKELQLQKQKENYLKARHILSDKQNTVENLRQKYADEAAELQAIHTAFKVFEEDGNLEAFMTRIKNFQYFGKR